MKAKLAMGLSMALFGTISIFVKSAGISSGMLSLCRAVIAIITILIFRTVSGNPPALRKVRRDIPWLFLSGAAMGFNWILLFEAYNYTSVSIATLSYYFAPILVMIACPLLFRERVTPLHLVCFIMSTVGIVLILNVKGGGGSNDLLGILLGLGAAVLYASVIIINKFIKNVAGIDRTLLQFTAAVIVLIPYVIFTDSFHFNGVGLREVSSIVLIGVLYTGIAYCVYFSTLPRLTGQETVLLSYLDPLVAVIVSVAVLGEPISALQLVGGVLVIGFTLLNELKGAKEAQS